MVLLRYGFGIGSIALQESSTYLHALVFMLGAAYTLKRAAMCGSISSTAASARAARPGSTAWAASCSCCRFCLFIIAISWPFVAEAWGILEGSPDPGGIHGVYLLKSLIPLMALSLPCRAWRKSPQRAGAGGRGVMEADNTTSLWMFLPASAWR